MILGKRLEYNRDFELASSHKKQKVFTDNNGNMSMRKRNGPTDRCKRLDISINTKRRRQKRHQKEKEKSKVLDGSSESSSFISKSNYVLNRNNEFVRAKRNKSSDIFTGEQVKKIVAAAVEERESELREEYDNLLLDRLDEQWEKFSAYTKDQTRQQMKSSVHDYFY